MDNFCLKKFPVFQCENFGLYMPKGWGWTRIHTTCESYMSIQTLNVQNKFVSLLSQKCICFVSFLMYDELIRNGTAQGWVALI